MGKPNRFIPTRTVLVVTEGEGEEAFCLFLKEFIRCSGARVVVKNAHGGSPDAIVAYAAKLRKQADYGEVVILLDADATLTVKGQAMAKRIKAVLVWAEPCLEGEVLRLLGRQVPPGQTTAHCEAACKTLGLDKSVLAGRDAWRRFPLAALQQTRSTLAWANAVLEVFGL